MKNYNPEDPGYKSAVKKVKDIKSFYIHLLVYILVNFILILIDTNVIRFGKFNVEPSSFYTAFFWGIGLAAHGARVFGPGLFLGEKWEEKKIKELMDKDRERMQKWE